MIICICKMSNLKLHSKRFLVAHYFIAKFHAYLHIHIIGDIDSFLTCCRLRKKEDDSSFRGRARRRGSGSETESADRDKGGSWFKFRDKSDTSETGSEQSR